MSLDSSSHLSQKPAFLRFILLLFSHLVVWLVVAVYDFKLSWRLNAVKCSWVISYVSMKWFLNIPEVIFIFIVRDWYMTSVIDGLKQKQSLNWLKIVKYLHSRSPKNALLLSSCHFLKVFISKFSRHLMSSPSEPHATHHNFLDFTVPTTLHSLYKLCRSVTPWSVYFFHIRFRYLFLGMRS